MVLSTSPASPRAIPAYSSPSSSRGMPICDLSQSDTDDDTTAKELLDQSPVGSPVSRSIGQMSPAGSPEPMHKSSNGVFRKTCSTLCPGTKFKGYQTSGSKRYAVEVHVKEVDLSKSYLCGDLVIHGLTPAHPTLATFFDAEIVGDRYGFRTGKWNSSLEVDLLHWRRFEAFAAVEKEFKRTGVYSCDLTKSDYLFMRWKERFIVPGADMNKLKGASFAGFYYICFNRRTGRVDGLYYHSQSEMYQRLSLTLDESRKFATYDFR